MRKVFWAALALTAGCTGSAELQPAASDSGAGDSGLRDSGMTDAGLADAGADAGSTDAGPTDAGTSAVDAGLDGGYGAYDAITLDRMGWAPAAGETYRVHLTSVSKTIDYEVTPVNCP